MNHPASRSRRPLALALVPCLLAVLAASAFAQEKTRVDTRRRFAHGYVSPVVTNTGAEVADIFVTTIAAPGAAALRLHFDAVSMGPQDAIVVHWPLSGQTQVMTAGELARWSYGTAWANEDVAQISLRLHPGSSGSFEVPELSETIPGALLPDTICGSLDDRLPSSDPRNARFDGGCTIWLAGNDNCALSAGHCFGGLTVAEFNVPLSTSSGSLVSPPIEDQFPIDQAVSQWVDGGQGNDWGITRLLPNNLGETPLQRYGITGYQINSFIPAIGDQIRITGYGTTGSGVPGEWNQAQKTHVGPFADGTGTRLGYSTDTTGGNSGSPVIHEASGEAIGIHTHGGCTSTAGTYNRGTSLSNSGFQTAWNQICNLTPAVPVAALSVSQTQVLLGSGVSFTDLSTGIPTSWQWDFDGNGTIDSTAQNPTHVYAAPGVYTVTLTVTNALGTDTLVQNALITVFQPSTASLPYAQDFGGGLPAPGSEWVFTSSNSSGAIAAGGSGTASPVSGDPALTMASASSNSYVTNDATLVLDLAGYQNVQLTYWWKETADESDPEDGLWLSDGINEVRAVSHEGGPSDWTQETVDISTFAANNGLVLNANFRLIWRQRDNYPIPTDGVLIDDIQVTGSSPSAFGLTLTSQGLGDAYLELSNIPAGATSGYLLISFATTGPVAQGPTFGLYADINTLFILISPALPGDLFHWTWPAPPGVWPASPLTFPAGALPPGLSLDAVGLILGSSGNHDATNVVRITF